MQNEVVQATETTGNPKRDIARRSIEARLVAAFKQENGEMLGELIQWASDNAIEFGVDREEFLKQVESAKKEVDPDKSAALLSPLFDPLCELYARDPERVEELRRKHVLALPGHVVLSDLMFYETKRDPSVARLHVTLGRELNDARAAHELRRALTNLAVKVSQDPKIQRVEAVSYIVAQRPELLTLAGFTIDSVEM